MKSLIFLFVVTIFSITSSICDEIRFKGLPLDIGNPEIKQIETPQHVRIMVDGKVALQRTNDEKKDVENAIEMIFINEKIVGVVEIFKGTDGYEHSANLVKSDNLVQFIQSEGMSYLIIRSSDTETILRVLRFDKSKPHVSVMK
jgi:hypothetical protein